MSQSLTPSTRPFAPPTKYLPLFIKLHQSSPESGTHSKRVAALAYRLGVALELTSVELHYLQIGASLHDIGKLHTPPEILHANHALDNAQWNIMRMHTTQGAEMATERRYDRRIIEAIQHHHERWNGEGYPSKLKGEGIPLHARIVTVVDAYDTIISKRCYQTRPRPIEEAVREVERCAGTQFDPHLSETFLGLLHTRYRHLRIN